MHNHNQVLKGSGSLGEGLQHTLRKQNAQQHRRGEDIFPRGPKKAAGKITELN